MEKKSFHLYFWMVFFTQITFNMIAKADDTIQLFSLQNYTQNINDFFNPSAPDYNTSLMSDNIIKERVENYKEHLYGKLSPWSESFITKILMAPPPNDIQAIEMYLLQTYRQGCDTHSPSSFAENFKPYPCTWFDDNVSNNMDLNQFAPPLIYNKNNRAIATDNIEGRGFPTKDPLFYSYKLAGQGYPFDNLQISALWAGSPLYVLGQTKDKLWSLIVANSGFITWVPTQKIAMMSESSISEYIGYANTYGLRTITHTESNIQNAESGAVSLTGYIGSIFPAGKEDANQIIIPIRQSNGFAKLTYALIDTDKISIFPLSPTPKNFAHIIHELLNRPYGWGGMHFYNDCSQETQSIFTVFGIWLARNSADQINAGKVEDLSAEDTATRLNHVSTKARKLVTLVYVKGHIMLYVGNFDYPNINTSSNISIPTVYNNLWGLRPVNNSYRSVIGQASFFPLFASYLYPADKNLISLADNQYRPIFKLSFLDQLPVSKPTGLFRATDDFSDKIDIRKMVYPENRLDHE